MTFEEATSKLGRATRAINKGSLKAISQTLAPDEDVVGLSTGVRAGRKEPGVVAVTSKRVLWASKTLGTGGVTDFRYDRLSTVQSGKHLVTGHTLALSTSGEDISLQSLKADYGEEIRSRIP